MQLILYYNYLNNHPSTELSSNIKETIAIEVATWYTEYRTNHPSDCKLDERRERNYPLAVLLPVVIDIITTKNVTTIDSPPRPHPPSPLEDPLHSITYPKWQGSFNNTFQDNTCPVDNILAILSLNQSTILNALSIKGVKPAQESNNLDIDQRITISHDHLTLHYQLAGFSIFFQNHFYSMLWNNGQFHKYDDLRSPATETWDCNSFYGTVNNVFYLLHSSD